MGDRGSASEWTASTRHPARNGVVLPALRSRARRGKPTVSYLGLGFAGFLVAYYAVVFIVPFGTAIWLSLQNWDFIVDPTYVGLANYATAFGDSLFWKALRVSIRFSVSVVAVGVGAQLLLAVLLSRLPGRPQRFLLVLYYLPVVVPTVVSIVLWRWLYLPAGGPLNAVFGALGLPEQPFLNSPQQALTSVAVMVVWTYIGTGTVLFLAGIHNIPQDFFEAAELDGASFLRQFKDIMLPLMTPVIFYQVIVSIVGTVQMFEELYLLSGPSFSTRTLAVYTYELGFQTLNLGYGAAVSVFIFALLLVVTVVQLRFYKVSWEY